MAPSHGLDTLGRWNSSERLPREDLQKVLQHQKGTAVEPVPTSSGLNWLQKKLHEHEIYMLLEAVFEGKKTPLPTPGESAKGLSGSHMGVLKPWETKGENAEALLQGSRNDELSSAWWNYNHNNDKKKEKDTHSPATGEWYIACSFFESLLSSSPKLNPLCTSMDFDLEVHAVLEFVYKDPQPTFTNFVYVWSFPFPSIVFGRHWVLCQEATLHLCSQWRCSCPSRGMLLRLRLFDRLNGF